MSVSMITAPRTPNGMHAALPVAKRITAMATAWVKMSTHYWYAEPKEKGDDLADPESNSMIQSQGRDGDDYRVISRLAMNGEHEEVKGGGCGGGLE